MGSTEHFIKIDLKVGNYKEYDDIPCQMSRNIFKNLKLFCAWSIYEPDISKNFCGHHKFKVLGFNFEFWG